MRGEPRLWEVLGAHPLDDGSGTRFAVWAPAARAVGVVGDAPGWDPAGAVALERDGDGVWQGVLAGVGPGDLYKYAVTGADGATTLRADPVAFRTEVPPGTASVVHRSAHEWGDGEWMAARAHREPTATNLTTYEVHLGSWRQGLGYRGLAEELVPYVADLGFPAVEFLPVAEHPWGPSWGYQVTGHFAPTARWGTPDDFRALVDAFHRAGIAVLVDWVPGHFPKDDWALARFDGTPLYEHADPRRAEHPEWGTAEVDLGKPGVRAFLVADALYWLEELHVDGLRVDAVASMLYLDYARGPGQWEPNRNGGREDLDAVSFLQELNVVVHGRCPGTTTVAEESTAWPGVSHPVHAGGLGFGHKWNMGWMHDTLGYFRRDPVHRRFHHQELTFGLTYAWAENFVLPLSHDEVVHGKGSLLRKQPGDRPQQLAGLRALLAWMWAHPGRPLLFMGGELAQDREWASDRSLDWELLDDPGHAGVQALVRRLNGLACAEPSLWTGDFVPEGFRWIDADDAEASVLSFLRADAGPAADDARPVACVANLVPVERPGFRVGVPVPGGWEVLLSTAAEDLGGPGGGPAAGAALTTDDVPAHGCEVSLALDLPPLAVLYLAPTAPAPTGPRAPL